MRFGALGIGVAFFVVDMEPLAALAAVPGQAPEAPPQVSLGAPGTDGLFEREVERAIERQDASGGERVAEARASAVEERRSDRRATFERERPEKRLAARDDPDPEPTQVLAASHVASPQEPTSTARGDAPRASAGPGGDPAGSGTPSGTSAGEASSAPSQALVPQAGAALAPGQGATGAASSSAAGPAAPISATTPNEATATFLQAARGGRGVAGATKAAVPAGDTALVEHAAEVLRQIRLALNPSAKRVVVDLNPEELGRLTIKMTMQDGRVSALVRAESPQTLELLERHLPELRAALAEGGVETGDIDLQLASDGRSREHSPPLRHPTPATLHSVASTSEEAAIAEPGSKPPSRTPVDGSVDTYA